MHLITCANSLSFPFPPRSCGNYLEACRGGVAMAAVLDGQSSSGELIYLLFPCFL